MKKTVEEKSATCLVESTNLEKREQFAVSLRRKKKQELINLKRGRMVIGSLSKAKFFAETDSKQKWRISDPGKVSSVIAVLHKQARENLPEGHEHAISLED